MWHSAIVKRITRVAAFAVILGSFSSCENPFSNNLGEKVNIAPPVISVTAPVSGDYIKSMTHFYGRASDERQLRKVEVKLFPNEISGEPGFDWTTAGIVLSGSEREKSWYYDLDTTRLNNRHDGSIKIRFRAFDDSSKPQETVDLVYIIKNRPSEIKMTAPDMQEAARRLITGTEIRGQITDRRGLKPGYPMIKLWPETNADGSPFNGGAEPADDDPNWGWVSMFLSGVDDALGTPDGGQSGQGRYVDRNTIPVKRAIQCSFNLDEYTINSQRQAVYSLNGTDHIPLESGRNYYFIIKTSDTYTDVNMLPREPVPNPNPLLNEVEIMGYFPGELIDPLDPNSENPFRKGEPVLLNLMSSDVRPTITLDNDDLLELDYSSIGGSYVHNIEDLRDAAKFPQPHIYILDPTVKKIATGRPGRPDFRLRALATHPDGIQNGTLRWMHESTGRSGMLIFDDIPGGLGYIDNTGSVSMASEGYRGEYKNPGNFSEGKLFTFTAMGGLKENDIDPLAANREIFTSSPDPYILEFTAYASDISYATQRYVLYLDGTGPQVSIRSMVGYASEPSNPAGMADAPSGGFKNDDPYIVNGNLLITVDRSDDSGIMTLNRSGFDWPLVKWVVQEDRANYLIESGTVYDKIKTYKESPSKANLEFFNSITDTPTSGYVLPVGYPAAADDSIRFKINTWKDNAGLNDWDGKDLWLFIIAEDRIQNLGFLMQKIHVDDSTDKPILDIGALGDSITSPDGLWVTVDAGKNQSGNVDASGLKKNILAKDQGIELNFIDDDGINLDTGGVTIILSDLNKTPNVTKTLSAAQVKNLLKNGNARDMSGSLGQDIMAAVLYADEAAAGRPVHLRDGRYKIQITVKDDINAKVAITPPTQPGDTPTVETVTKTLYFAVYTELPEITVDTPLENSLQSEIPVAINGTVKSRLQAQQLWISFNPDVLAVPASAAVRPQENLPLYADSAYTQPASAAAPDTNGYYTYYWQYGSSVNFNPTPNPYVFEWRRVSLETVDRLGNTSQYERTVMVDTTPPEVSLSEFNYNRAGDLNGKVPAVISASDTNGLMRAGAGPADHVGLKWWLLPAGSPAPAWDSPIPAGGAAGTGGWFTNAEEQNGGKFTANIDTRAIPDLAGYVLYAAARDNAGNITVTALTSPASPVLVDQSADIPVVNASDLNPNGGVRGRIGLSINGTITDDDGFDAAKLSAGHTADSAKNTYVQIRFPNPSPSWGPWINVPGSLDPAGNISFNFNLADYETFLGSAPYYSSYFAVEGTKNYQIRVTDEAAAGPNNKPSGKNPDGAVPGDSNYIGPVSKIYPNDTTGYSFTLDLSPPNVFFHTADPASGHPHYSAVRPTFQTTAQLLAALNGADSKVEETNLQSMSFSYGAYSKTLTFTPGLSTHPWGSQIIAATDLTAFAPARPGPQSITIEAMDTAGNVARVAWIFTKDTQGPGAQFTNIGRKITHNIVPGNSDFPDNTTGEKVGPVWPSDWPYGTAWNAWHANWKAKIANWSSEYAFMEPVKVVAALNAENSGAVSIITDQKGPAAISGKFTDELSHIWNTGDTTVNFEYRFDSSGRGDAAPWTTGPLIIAQPDQRNNSADWEIPIPGGAFADGEHTFDLRARDKPDNLTDIYGLRFIVDREIPRLNVPLTQPPNTTPSLPTVNGGGSATNAALTETERVFSAASATDTVTTEVFTISGIVSDNNLSELSAVLSTDGNNGYNVVSLLAVPDTHSAANSSDTITYKAPASNSGNNRLSIAPTTNPHEWTWTFKVYQTDVYALRNLSGTNDGSRRSITLVATDKAKRKTVPLVWYFYLDSVKPRIEFTNVEKGDKFSIYESPAADISLQGVVSDETKIKELRYNIAKWNYQISAWQWWNGSAWSLNAIPVVSAWPSLLDASYTAATATSQITWTLNQAKTNAAGATKLPANLFNTEGQYRIDLYVTDWSLSTTPGIAGNPHNTSDSADTTYADVGYTHPTGNASPRKFFIDRAEPAIVWSSTDQNKTYYKSDVGGRVKFTLTVQDANTIAAGAAFTIKDAAGADVSGLANITITGADGSISGNAYDTAARTVTVTPDMSGQSNANYTISLSIKDGAGKSASANITKQFILDNENPVLLNINPAGGNATVTGRINIRGNTTDNSNLLTKVAYYVAHSGNSYAAPPISSYGDKAQGWHYYEDGQTTHQIKAGPLATDQVIMEIEPGTFTWNIRIPNARHFLTGSVGPTLVQTMTKAGAGDTQNLTWNGAPVPTGDDVCRLKIYLLAEDQAGNQIVEEKIYWLYPEGDRPLITSISNPDESKIEAERLMNGRVRLSGIARDNERVRYVWFRVLDTATGNPITNLHIPNWNQITWDPIAGEQTPRNFSGITVHGFNLGAGWYMANGGGASNVTWWAYVNTEGELDPVSSPGVGAGSHKITIQVVAEDTTWDDAIANWETGKPEGYGMISRQKAANAFVVAGAPIFDQEQVSAGKSADATSGGTWDDILNVNIKGRGSYRITVKDDAGVQAIRWTPVGGSAINLLNTADPYNSTTYASDLANMDAGTPSGPGIAVKAAPKKVLTGSLSATDLDNKTFLIWKWDDALESSGLISHDTTHDSTHSNMQFTAFTNGTVGAKNIGAAELIEKTADGFFEWVVTVDVNTGILKDPAAPAQTCEGKSLRYPISLTATDISRPTPLASSITAYVPIDNLAPQGAYTINRRPAGTAATIGGEAGDSGAVSGLSRVILWFSRGATNVSWHEKDIYNIPNDTGSGVLMAAGTYTPGAAISALNAAGATVNITLPQIPAAGAASGGDSAIVIDRNDPAGSSSHHGHKLAMGFGSGGSMGTTWYVEFNSYGLTSGPIDANYVVYDKAGNARYYKTRIVVMNNAPAIARIKLATDIRQDAGMQTAIPGGTANYSLATGLAANAGNIPLDKIRGRFAAGLSDVQRGITDPISTGLSGAARWISDFTVRNSLLALRVETTGIPDVSKPRHFRFEYVAGATILRNASLLNIKAGRVYIINEPGDATWGSVGAPQLTYTTGLAFLAAVDGSEGGVPNISWSATSSVWELNTAYYPSGTPPTALQLADVNYTAGAEANFANNAEFVYKNAAFDTSGAAQGSKIINYKPALDADGAYPPPVNVNPSDAYSLFIIRVFDGPEVDIFADFSLVAIRVNNNDVTVPKAQLYDLNPLTEGTEWLQTQQRSVAPQRIGDNRTRGGLWNTVSAGTFDIVKPGHIEPRATTALTSVQMGGAASRAEATVAKPWANPAAYFAKDTVSGQVVLRGYAEDDQRIQRIDLRFRNAANSTDLQTVTILDRDTAAASTGNPSAYIGPATGLLKAAAASAGRVFFTDTIDLYRHRVEWAYVWDTETIPTGTMVGDITVRGLSYNENTGAADPATTAKVSPVRSSLALSGGLNDYNEIGISLRPYITGFLRDQSLFYNNTRSRQGWYSAAREETLVMSGFNLYKGATTVNMRAQAAASPWAAVAAGVDITAAGPDAADQANFDLSGYTAARYRKIAVPATAAPGPVRLIVDGYPAANTVPLADATAGRPKLNSGGTAAVANTAAGAHWVQPWNTERSPAKDGSDLWDDYSSVHVWQSNNTAPATGNDGGYFSKGGDIQMVMHPAMTIEPATGKLWSSHNEGGAQASSPGSYNRGTTMIGSNGGDAATTRGSFVDPVIMSDIYYSPGGGTDGTVASPWSAYSIIGRGGSEQAWRQLGGLWIYGPGGATPNLNTGSGSQYHAESTWYNASTQSATVATPATTDQFENPHIVTSYLGSNEHIHVSYYDSKDGSLHYRHNMRSFPGTINAGSGGPNGLAAARGWINLDGGTDADDTNNTHTLTLSEANLGANVTNRYVRQAATSGTQVSTGEQLFVMGAAAEATTSGQVTIYAPVSGYFTTTRSATKSGTNFTTLLADTDILYTIEVAPRVVARTANPNVGRHNAIDTTREGYPVVAYYDQTNQRLKLAVSNSHDPYAANWKIRDNVIPADNLSAFGTGEFVSIRIDKQTGPNQNRIHIAALNSINKNLVYITGVVDPANVATAGDVLSGVTTTTVQVVDSVGDVGRWCDISLDQAGNPWIAYQDESYRGSMDGVRVAYRDTNADGSLFFTKELGDLYGTSIQGWEILNVPARYRVNNERISIENYPTRNNGGSTPRFWNTAVGYLAPDYFRIAYYVKRQ
jgi:hypothetical protein